MTPMTRTPGQFGDGSEEATIRGDWNEWQNGEWIETRTISTGVGWDSPISNAATVGVVAPFGNPLGHVYIWVGGSTPDPRPAGDETR